MLKYLLDCLSSSDAFIVTIIFPDGSEIARVGMYEADIVGVGVEKPGDHTDATRVCLPWSAMSAINVEVC